MKLPSFFRKAWLALTGRLRLRKIFRQIAVMPGGQGRDVAGFLSRIGVSFSFSDAVNFGRYQTRIFYKDGVWQPVPDTQEIIFNPDEKNTALAAALLHEARHLRQVFNHVSEPPAFAPPADFILYSYCLEADAQADAVLRAFRAKLAGDDALFRAWAGTGYDVMIETAEREHRHDPSALDDGRLRRMVFDAWFLCPGKAVYYANQVLENWERCHNIFRGKDAPKRRLALSEIEKIGTTGGEIKNYLTIPGFRSLRASDYMAGLSPAQKKKLTALTADWEGQVRAGDCAPTSR